MCHLYTCSLHDSTLTPPNSITIPLILSDFSPPGPKKKNIIIPRFRFGAWCPCRDWKRCRLAAKLFRSPEPRNSVGGTSSAEPRAEGTSGTSRTSCHETREWQGLGRYWILLLGKIGISYNIYMYKEVYIWMINKLNKGWQCLLSGSVPTCHVFTNQLVYLFQDTWYTNWYTYVQRYSL